jgi:glycosyltransferase involved in cell wall biosynthesis
VGGIADVVLENTSALLSEIGDSVKFSENLLRLVTDDKLRQSFSNAGRDFVLNKFGHLRLVNDMSKLYHELLEKKSTKS